MIDIEVQDRDTIIWPRDTVPYKGARFASLDGEHGTLTEYHMALGVDGQDIWVAVIKWDNEPLVRRVQLLTGP